VWEGYGWLPLSDHAAARELRLDQRTFLVIEGSIAGATAVGSRYWNGPFQPEPPTLIWPASTYVGGSTAMIEALLATPGLEAWPIGSTDRVTLDSDTINGIPPDARRHR
jgi:hypothetical protein